MVLLVSALLALPLACPAQQYLFDSYQQPQGLANLSVQDMAFDKQGFLWVATANGLFRFLGSRFEHYGPEEGIKERNVQSVYVDPEGRIWVGTVDNLYLWDGVHFYPISSKPIPIWLSHGIVAMDRGRLLVRTDGQLLLLILDANGRLRSSKLFFSSDQRRKTPELDVLSSLSLSRDGALWMGCGKMICSLHEGKVRTWGRGAGLLPGLWRSLYSDRRGSLWAVSQEQVAELPAGATRFVDRTPPGGGPTGLFYWLPLLEDRQGRILVDAATGLARWDGKTWQNVSTKNGLTANRITSLALDPIGDPWMGSFISGVAHWIGYEHWEGWSDRQGLPSSITWSLDVTDPGYAWIGTVKGLARIHLKTRQVSPVTGVHPWTYGQVGGIAHDRRGDLWATTFSGSVLHIDHTTLQVELFVDLKVFIHRSFMGQDGRLWILSDHGVYVIDHPETTPVIRHMDEVDRLLGATPDVVTMAEASPVKATVQSATRAKATPPDLWFLADSVPVLLRAGQWSTPHFSGSSPFNAQLKEMSLAPDGSLWAYGMDEMQHGCLWHIKEQASGFAAERVPLPGAFLDLLPMSFLVDRRGWLWLGTDTGLVAWNGDSWRHFTEESGLIWNDASRGVLREAIDGSIWIGTSTGAGHLLHPERAFDRLPLSVAIISIKRNNRSLLPAETAAMPWGATPISFRFASPSASNRSGLNFSYRLHGLESSWITTQDTDATFPGLPPGTFRFEVFAYNADTGTTSPVAASTFSVLPPWWKTFWFYYACAVAAVALVWLVLWLRTRHLMRNQHKLEILVQERTRELEESREAFRIQATHDGLTGLLNRAAVLDRLGQEIDRFRREGIPLAVVMADIDHFKSINDTHGHPAGDAVLRQFAFYLGQSIRPYDHVGRYGGEEFLLVLANIAHDNVDDRLLTLHASLSNLTVHFEEKLITLTCSMGACLLQPCDQNTDVSQLLSSADGALYQAKRGGRNRLVQAHNLDPAHSKVSL